MSPATYVAQHADGTVFRLHDLKTPEPYFGMVESGTKTFDVRRNDRAYQAGDVLRLYRPRVHSDDSMCRSVECFQCATPPDHLLRTVTCVYAGDSTLPDDGGLRAGYVVLGLMAGVDAADLKAAFEAGAMVSYP